MTYSTVARVRDLSGLTDVEFITSDGSASIKTRKDFIEVTSVLVDGVSNSSFTAVRPRTLTFSPALSNGAVVQIDYDVYFSDAQVTSFIDDADAVINAYLDDAFTVPFVGTAPALIATLSAQMAASRILQSVSARINSANSSDLANDLRSQALETIELLQSGQLTIPGIDSGQRNSINVSTKGKKKVFHTRPDLNETWHEMGDAFDRDEGQDYGNGDLQSYQTG